MLRFLPPLDAPRVAAVSRALRAGAGVRAELLERDLPRWQPRPEAPVLRLAYRPAQGWAVERATAPRRRRDRTPLWSRMRRRPPGWWLTPDCVVRETREATQLLLSCHQRGLHAWPRAVIARVAVPPAWSALVV